MLRPLTYALGSMYISAYYRRPAWGMTVFMLVHLMIFGISTDFCISGSNLDFMVFSPLVAFLGSVAGALFVYVYHIREMSAAYDSKESKFLPFDWVPTISSIGQLIVLMTPFIFYDWDAWEGTWWSYLATMFGMLTAGTIAFFISIWGAPANIINFNSRKLHMALANISLLLLVVDWIFTATGIMAWGFWVPIGALSFFILIMIIFHYTGVVRKPDVTMLDTTFYNTAPTSAPTLDASALSESVPVQ